jgi:L-threonylcarbamoyladenylate synthase
VKTRVLAVDIQTPQPDVVRQAVETLKRGGLVAFPTDTLYALGADARDAEAVERVFTVKGRQHGKPLSVLVASAAQAAALAQPLSPDIAAVMQAFWPGPLTLVVRASDALPSSLSAQTGTLGLRLPGGSVAQALLAAMGGPIIGTSANKTGGADPADAKMVQRAIGGQIDLLLDGGRVPLGVPSTVLDCTQSPARILREGAVSRAALARHVPLA